MFNIASTLTNIAKNASSKLESIAERKRKEAEAIARSNQPTRFDFGIGTKPGTVNYATNGKVMYHSNREGKFVLWEDVKDRL